MGRVFFWKIWIALILLLAAPASAQDSYVLFESGPVRPLALSPDGTRLFVCNVPDSRLEIFAVSPAGLAHLGSVPVGLEPVAVAARSDGEVWVVNHMSDSVSIVDVADAARHPHAAGRRRAARHRLRGREPRRAPSSPPRTADRTGRGDPQLLDRDGSRPQRRLGVRLDATWARRLGGTPLAILNLFGDTPRALAVTPDGSKVYAAVFQSGNQTTVDSGGTWSRSPVRSRPSPRTPRPPDERLTHHRPSGRRDAAATSRARPGADATGAAYTDNVPVPAARSRRVRDRRDSPRRRSQTGVYRPRRHGPVQHDREPASRARCTSSNTDANNMDRFEGFGTPNLRGELHKARISILTGSVDGHAAPPEPRTSTTAPPSRRPR